MENIVSGLERRALRVGLLIGLTVTTGASGQAIRGEQPATNLRDSTRCVMQENVVAAEVIPVPNQAQQAALAMQRLGLRVLHIGPTISVQGPQLLWESTFNVTFEARQKTIVAEVAGGTVTYQKALTETMRTPPELQNLIEDVVFVEPPEFY